MTPSHDPEGSAVLDACVLAPMPLCDTLLRCAEEPALYHPLWSEQTLEEVDRTLQKFGYDPQQAARRIRQMQQAFPEATIAVQPERTAKLQAFPDPNDRHVVATAIQAHAKVIVTANLKHFSQELLNPHHVLVQSPDDFLVRHFRTNPKRILDILDAQAITIRQTPQELLDRLQPALPKFSALILNAKYDRRRHLQS